MYIVLSERIFGAIQENDLWLKKQIVQYKDLKKTYFRTVIYKIINLQDKET